MHAFVFATHATKGARGYQEDLAKVWSGAGDAPAPDKVRGASGVPDVPVARDDSNDDARPQVVAVLADGMGGHVGGARAAQVVCETFVGTFSKSNGEAAGNGGVPERLMSALSDANAAVAQCVLSEPMLTGMGSTMVGVNFDSHGVHWVSVGDSPLLLFRRGEIAQLNADHSLAPEIDALAQAGKISFEEAKSDPRRSMLRSAVSGDELDLIDRSRKALKLETGDYVILASDGLQTLEEIEVERIVSAYADDGARAVAKALIRSVDAVRAPHQDNATVVVVRVVDGVASVDQSVEA